MFFLSIYGDEVIAVLEKTRCADDEITAAYNYISITYDVILCGKI